MVYHLIVGDEAAKPLLEAFPEEKVIVLRDILNVGPLQKAEGQSFSRLRSEWWQQVAPNDRQPVEVNDLERLLEASTTLNNDEASEIWIWMGQIPADVCAFFWALPYLQKHAGRVKVVSLAGLPFLDDDNKVFFPKSFAEGAPREILKSRRLARTITGSEWETDGEEWEKLANEDLGIRVLAGGKKLAGRAITYFDDLLEKCCTEQFQKASRVVAQAMKQQQTYTGDTFLKWRLREMAAAGTLALQTDASKNPRDFEVALQDAKPAIAHDIKTAAGEAG